MVEEPRYWGSWKGRVVKAIAIDGARTWTEIRNGTGLSPKSLNKVLAKLFDAKMLEKKKARTSTELHTNYTRIMEYFSGSHWSFTEQIMIEDVTIKRITASTITDTATETTTTKDSTTDEDKEIIVLFLLFAGVCVVVGLALASKRTCPASAVLSGAKVLIICPYCGAKTEQGITKCQKCGAEL